MDSDRRPGYVPAVRRLAFVPLLILFGCGRGRGTVAADWRTLEGPQHFSVEGAAAWCPGRGPILVGGVDGERVAGVVWRTGTPAAGTYALGLPPLPEDTTPPPAASVAFRYIQLDEVRGYQSVSGSLAVTDTAEGRLSGRVDALLQRIGESDTLTMRMEFRGVRLTVDSTLCPAVAFRE